MKNKRISILIAILGIMVILLGSMVSYAKAADTPIYVNLTKTNVDGVGYGVGNPNPPSGGTSNAGEYIWNITTYDSMTATNASATQRNLYCVKANYGATWETAGTPGTKVQYNLQYDLQNDRQAILNKLVDNTNDGDDVVRALLDPTGNQYRQLLWILDNAYIEGQTNKDEFFAKMGILKDEDGYYNKDTLEMYDFTILTDADIKSIQRVAIWYFTNGGEFDKTAQTQWLNITTNGTDYQALSKVATDGEIRNKQANILYNYLIESAKNNASQYTAENNYTIEGDAVTVNTTGLTQENNKYKLQTTRVGTNNITGPIVIAQNNNLEYGITITVTDKSGNNVGYTFTDANGTAIENATIKSLVGRTEGFYISTTRNTVDELNITINVTQEKTKKTLWLNGSETETEIKLIAEQPIVEITKETKPTTITFTSKPEEFDLALRKYIIAKNGQSVTNTRVPNIDLSTLQSETTATYKHRKDPVLVEDGDVVTYAIAIYNEGNKAGYASKIVDQLPTGLIWANDNENGTVISKDKNGNVKNTYKIEWDQLTSLTPQNRITLTIDDSSTAKSLNPYTQGNLDYETIEIKCKVAQEPDEENQIILTNVAWIAAAYDSEAQKEISSSGTTDRDSAPQTLPTINTSNNMVDYKGNTVNPSDLSNSGFFYEGYQDDDDFEKLVIEPVKKKFDLALVKFIVAISDDQTIEEGEYLKESDGTYSRAPEVKIDSATGEIIYDFTNRGAKNPLVVEPGDYVLYTIRVYNEGEIDGYASKIKDELPEGLEFVKENATYNGIWAVDEETLYDNERIAITTDWYAKGNIYETLLTAFDKEVAISDENPDYLDAQVLCRVSEKTGSNKTLVNYAQISDDSDENGDPIDDIDSTPDVWDDGDDDQDIEKVKVEYFDLALRKFITSVNETELKDSKGNYTRQPVVDLTPLKDGTGTTAIYNHTKIPVSVEIGDTVEYTIRVYNEGDKNGYASEVTDYLPEYLTYDADSETNKQYGWQISEDGRIATTRYLSNNELTGFNGTTLDYADVKIECIVSGNAPVKQKQTNIAEISEYTYNGTAVPEDIDSAADNMVTKDFLPSDEELPTYNDEKLNDEYVPGNEDDDDFEKIYVKYLDLSLRKFIISVNGESLNGQREPVVDLTPLKDGTGTTAIYKHPKTPVALKVGDKIIYTIRVYNEGEAAGYANEVKDYLPPYLTYDVDSNINKQYGWQISEDGRIATTSYLSDKKITGFDGNTLDYEDIQIECIISENAIPNESITNIAEISEYKYGETVVPEDIDSESDNIDEDMPTDEELPTYKDEELDKEYVPGNEDEDDFEKIYIKEFDLALRKFITQVQNQEITTRVPQIKNENGQITYEHTKEPITLHVGDVVIYTLRIYNEGELSGYASKITDDIPEYLEYLPNDSTNVEYMWKMYDENGVETENVEDAVKVQTEYLSKENGEDNLIAAFDGTILDYKDIKIAFKVKDPSSNQYIITNYAQISDDTDKDGKPIKDKDSETDKWNEGEDDQDIENVKVEYFDLALLKFVSKVIVIENGKEEITETGYNGYEDPEPVVKVELHKKKLDEVVVKFGYGITITNEGDIPGYATEITDYVPEGLRFEAADNPLWTDEGNNVISTKQLENTLLQPGESTTIEVIFTWINGNDNLGLKTNTAEISQDENEYDVPDKDSTPDNKEEGEDDIDIAKVILTVATGRIQTYFTLTLGLLAVVVIGILLIKKFVL